MEDNEPIVGQIYLCFRGGKFIGEATFVEDKNIGESFIRVVVSETGELVNEVYQPDEWILKTK